MPTKHRAQCTSGVRFPGGGFKKDKMYLLGVSYESNHGIDPVLDDRIEKLVGRLRCGSSFGLSERNLEFAFKRFSDCLTAFKKIDTSRIRYLIYISISRGWD